MAKHCIAKDKSKRRIIEIFAGNDRKVRENQRISLRTNDKTRNPIYVALCCTADTRILNIFLDKLGTKCNFNFLHSLCIPEILQQYQEAL